MKMQLLCIIIILLAGELLVISGVISHLTQLQRCAKNWSYIHLSTDTNWLRCAHAHIFHIKITHI